MNMKARSWPGHPVKMLKGPPKMKAVASSRQRMDLQYDLTGEASRQQDCEWESIA